jgi:hypothetical protein
MNFANYSYKSKRAINIGDYMQILAIDNVYRQMGIPKEDIIYIDVDDVSTYDGDYVVLPIGLLMHNVSGDKISDGFSKKIIPVFLCYATYLTQLKKEDVAFLSKYEPIGCRDAYTASLLSQYGIQSYVNGCLTATFPKADVDRTAFSKIFIVDASEELKNAIPDNVKAAATYFSHLVTSELENPKAYTKTVYEKYVDEAMLVVTSRLHCAVPCMAAGIPVIFACDKYSARFTWIDKVIPVYTLKEYSQIDWNPKAVQFDEEKALILSIAVKRLTDAYQKYNDIYTISYYYEQKSRPISAPEGMAEAIQSISQKYNQVDIFTYSVWGLTTFAQNIINYISEEYPNAVLTHVYDKYRRINFCGLIAEDPEKIAENKKDFLFIALTASRTDAEDYMNRINRLQGTYLFLVNPLAAPLSIENL